jgi:hypothetical protein
MSYDIHLAYPDERECLVGNHADGGTFVIGGTDEAWLNVTYNYSRYFYRNIDDALGIRWLYGKTGQQASATGTRKRKRCRRRLPKGNDDGIVRWQA